MDLKDSVLQQITGVIPAALIMFSADYSQVIYVSPVYEKVYGRSCESLHKQPGSFLSHIHPEDQKHVIISDRDNLGENYELEYRIAWPNGTIRWVNDRVSAIYESGKIQGIVRFVEDITERKQIYESLRDSFQRSVEIVQAIPSGLFIYQYEEGDKLIFIDGNPAAERLTGLKIDDWRNLEFDEMWSKAFEIGLTEKCLNVIKTGDPIEIDDLYYKDNRFDGNLRLRIFRMPGDQLGIAFENITELKKSGEREAQAYAEGRLSIVDTLLHNIGNAINSVTTGIGTIKENLNNSKLTKHLISLSNAVEAHRHDFGAYVENDPQGKKVADFITALANDFAKQDEELSKIVDRVRERAQHVADIIRTEKVLSKRSTYRKDINLRKAIDEAVSVLSDSLRKRNIDVIIDCEEAPKEISIQESQFHQMLINLVKNSIEAIDDLNNAKLRTTMNKKFEIKIKSYVNSEAFIIEISDNGIGIEENKLEVIFRPGYTTKDSGSGLGLHSVANFVNSCGGNIFALSDGYSKGATMRIVLPKLHIS